MTSVEANMFRPSGNPFVPVARYYPAMDFLLYLNADCAYRADRVDTFLTLLWHPLEDRLVGLKLKGFRFLFNQVKAISGLEEADFLPVVKLLETALVGGVAEAAMTRIEQKRVEEQYAKAKEFAREEHLEVRPDVFQDAA